MLLANLPPSWVLKGAKYDFWFSEGKYWGADIALVPSSSSALQPQSAMNLSAGTVSARPNAQGIVAAPPTGTLPIFSGTGLWCEPDVTNSALQCRTFTNAVWTATNMTVAKDQVGADGVSNSAHSLLATGANATLLQSITLASATVITSCYVKRLVGSGGIFMTQDNGGTWTDITSSVNSASYTRCNVPSALLTNPTVGFKIATSGDKIAVDYFQTENSTTVSGCLVTVGSTVRRNVETLAIGDISGSHPNNGQKVFIDIFGSGTEWSGYYEYSGSPLLGAGWVNAMISGQLQGGADGSTVLFASNTAGAATTANTGNAGVGNINKVCVRGKGGAGGSSVCLNGGAIATGATTGTAVYPISFSSPHNQLMNNGAGTAAGPLNGYVKRMAWWTKALADGEMISRTS